MKFSKTDNNRVYVSKYKGTETEGRGGLYKTPKSKNQGEEAIEKQINDRIEEANKLYRAFFPANNNLEKCFSKLANRVSVCKDGKCREELLKYKPALDSSLSDYILSNEKGFRNVMDFFVQKRFTETWQEVQNKEAAVGILVCICDGRHYEERIADLPESTLENFKRACEKCCVKGERGNPYSKIFNNYRGTEKTTLERQFSELLKAIAKISRNPGDKDQPHFEEMNYEWASKDVLEVMCRRLRHTLKRGSNKEIAIMLLQGLAQNDGKTLSSVLNEMQADPQLNEQLKHFVDTVQKDYYHTNALESIKHTDVKVQPEEQNAILALAHEEKPQKAALNETLLQYTSSKENSDKILLDIKRILFRYFDTKDNNPDNIWKIKSESDTFFDDSFVEAENKKDERKCGHSLGELWESEPNFNEIKDRIKYVNYGMYLKCLERADNDFEKYWSEYIKEYIEKNYTGKRKLSREGCFKTKMLSDCWMNIIRFLCGKYIDIGKAVYHFAMPEDLQQAEEISCGEIRDEYTFGISSFDYEVIKAEETLQRDLSVIATTAVSSFSSSIIDEAKRQECIRKERLKEGGKGAKLDDVLFIEDGEKNPDKDDDKPVLWDMTKQNAVHQLLRYYGGASEIKNIDWKESGAEHDFIRELKSHLKAIRNENFHYMTGKTTGVDTEYTRLLWENERNAYSDIVRHRYYTNNTGMFYDEDKLCKLVGHLYTNNRTAESQIPAFKNIWKRKDLDTDIAQKVSGADAKIGFKACLDDKGKQLLFANSLYFLLKEIYYRSFITDKGAKEYFFRAADAYKSENPDGSKYHEAVKNFNDYIDDLKREHGELLTFGGICQAITQEYSQQNAKKQDKKIFQHYKMLLPKYIKRAFEYFIVDDEKPYSFLQKPRYKEMSEEQHFLDNVIISRMKFPKKNSRIAVWYTLAHFIQPCDLNLLVGDLKSYIQYRQDIARRMDCADEVRGNGDALKSEIEEKTQQAQDILQVLDFVKVTAGRISNCFEDYYEDENSYADYLSQYIDFKKTDYTDSFGALKHFFQNTLPDGAVIDIYTDEKNPKVLRNIELARMYSGGDVPISGRSPVNAGEICKYYENKPMVDTILSKGLCKDKDEQQIVVDQQCLKGRITLNDVTDLYTIISDLLGKLISLAYLRERDQMYLLLGFYYMALQSENGWDGEELQAADLSDCSVRKGLVLYQVVSIFDYGIQLPYINRKGKWKKSGGALPGKYMMFHDMHGASMDCALRLFGEDKKLDDAVELRDYIDHGKYYVDHSKSIVGLYQEYYNVFFGYSSKLRNSVAYNLKSLLERYFVEAKLKYKKENTGFELEGLSSAKFTYKLQGHETCRIDAKDQHFLNELKAVLEYRK